MKTENSKAFPNAPFHAAAPRRALAVLGWSSLLLVAAACGEKTDNGNNPGGGPGNACAAVGDTCAAGQTLNTGFVCVGGTCREGCAQASPDPCDAGSYCTGGTDSYCKASSCTDFFAADCATSTQKCGPMGNGASDCFSPGATAAGQACDSHGDCVDELLCLGGFCLPVQCSDTSAAAVACTNPMICRPYEDGEIDYGVCVNACTPFVDACGTTDWCIPDSGYGAGEGICYPQGPSAEGVACGGTTLCGEGLACIGTASGGLCRRVCEVGATTGPGDTCDSDQSCQVTGAAFGVCIDSCTPFVDACDATTWCLPSTGTGAGQGVCTNPTGTGAVGVACGQNVGGCAEGLTCAGPTAQELACRTVCDPAAAPAAPGDTCVGPENCASLQVSGPGGPTPLPYGACL